MSVFVYQEYEKLAKLKLSLIDDNLFARSNETDESQVMLDINMS